MLKNTFHAYGSVAKSFHWLMAVLIVGMLILGFVMTGYDNTPTKFKLYGWHKSIGVSILVLAGLRLLWKCTQIMPSLPVAFGRLEKALAHGGHALLYVLMFAMPLSGWAMSSAAGFPVSVFGWFTLPNLVAPNAELKHLFADAHYFLAWGLIAIVGAHVSAALLHHFYFKDTVLRKMLPFVKGPRDAQAHSSPHGGNAVL